MVLVSSSSHPCQLSTVTTRSAKTHYTANGRFGEDSYSVDRSLDYIVYLTTARLLPISRECVVYTHHSSAATIGSLKFRTMPDVSPNWLQTNISATKLGLMKHSWPIYEQLAMPLPAIFWTIHLYNRSSESYLGLGLPDLSFARQ